MMYATQMPVSCNVNINKKSMNKEKKSCDILPNQTFVTKS